MPSPASTTLHDPRLERDACGIGFVADASGRRSRGVVDLLLAGLAGVEHRGAAAADATGDGAGVLLPLPGTLVPSPGCGLAMLFLRGAHEEAVEAACRAEGIEPAGWRDVPVDAAALGEHARATMPRVRQLLLAPPRAGDEADAEGRAFRARRRAERIDGVYAASFSFRTVTYKALCSASHLVDVYPDLRDPHLEAAFGLFHQRFSTNTQPTWERAQPFRLLGHNGEINAIEGNARWLRAREGRLGAADEELLVPVLDWTGSDSAMLDEALELLVRHGRDVRHALAMLVPEAPRPGEDDELRDFYRYHAGLVEPWDGPAALVFSDGRVVGAALDRNGLRPLRFHVQGDLVACASEAGAIPLEGAGPTLRGRLGPGEMIAVDPERGLQTNGEIKSSLARRRPYRAWLEEHRLPLDPGEPVRPPAGPLVRAQALHGYTREELSLVLRPLAGQGSEPVSSMGDDTALPPLAGRSRPLASYFRQRFAQVTNPALDHLRERSVMSLATLLGRRAPLLAEVPAAARLGELPSFFLYPSGLAGLGSHAKLDALFSAREGLERACERLCDAAEAAVRAGEELLLLSDARAGSGLAPVPSLLAVAAVHARLVSRGLRPACSIVVDSCEPRESHHFATLLGYGADAICPRLALETVAALAAADKLGGDRPDPDEAQRRFRAAVEDGVLKVMSKLGISDLASYRGAQLFQAVGIGEELLGRYFPGTPGGIGGIGLAELEAEALARLEQADAEEAPQLENPGYVKFRKGGEQHETSPEVLESLQESLLAAHALRSAVRHGRSKAYSRFSALVHARRPMELRDLLELVPAGPAVLLAEVEPVESVVRRFSGGAMSYGALSAEAHEVLAIALNRLGARSNCGEGGEDPERYRTERNSRIKQIASARFGVTPEYAVFADELQIKISQGSKPGEGGQIPAHKVTAEIARLRHTRPGVQLISPPPHHDIYSIEDLAQLIFDLRQVSPEAAISVKLVAEAGVGLVAAGVAKALADVIHIAGADGGTGASPLTSIKNAGAPWELGLAETQQALVANGLRGRVRLRADGGFKTGRDVVVAALLGADEYSFGTALLLAEGCLMVRSCHLDTCPVGIASQRPELRAKFAGTPEMVEAYLLFVAGEARRLLASLGLRSFDEAVGRVECLRQRVTGDARADSLDLAALLGRGGRGPSRFAGEPVPVAPGGELGALLAEVAAPALEATHLVEPVYPITTRDRAVGARLGGSIARVFGSRPPRGRVRARFEGSAGQSFGAFLAAGAELDLVGEANDYVGKSMSGGRIVIAPPEGDAGMPVLAGNTVLYGATGGELFVAGRAGERFAVRNSGATAVVEGVGDHACEYMTAGTVVVLGSHGANFGAGMTGGEAIVLDADEALLHADVALVPRLSGATSAQLCKLLERHARATGSPVAAALLADWDAAAGRFASVQPAAAVAVPVEEEISA